MERGTGQHVQYRAQSLYREDAIRRILQVVDEVGGHVTSVGVQNAALHGVLDSDTFWHSQRNGTFVKYDLSKMRELAARITRDAKLTPASGEDRVTLLFRVQSGGLPSDLLLKWRYESNEIPLVAQDGATPELSVQQPQEFALESAFSPTLIDDAAVALRRRQSRMMSTEPGTFVTLHSAKSRRLKRKASTGIEESPPSEASSLDIARSPIVCPTPRRRGATHVSNDHNATRFDQPQHLSPKDVIQQLQCIRDLQIDQALWMIDYFKLSRSPSPVTVTPEPNQLLAALYRRCWGDEWRRDGDMLLRQDKRSVFNDTMALISAFLLDHVFTAAKPAAEILQSDSDPSPQLLALRTELLQTKLLAALNPFFSVLVQITRAMYSTPFDGSTDPLLDPQFQQFETALLEIVTKTVALKSELDRFDLAPTFVWPQNGEPYDGEQMQTAHAVDPGLAGTYTVAYTTFPGVLMPRAGDSLGFTAFKAFVVLQVVAKR
jgi:hypothetical protein